MSFAAVLLPFLAAPVLGLAGAPLAGAYGNLAVCAAVFLLTCATPPGSGGGLLQADPLGTIFAMLTGLAALATAVANIGFVRGAGARYGIRHWRVHHALCQAVLGCTLLGLYADDLILLWLAVAGATLAATLAASLSRRAAALEIAWKTFLSGGLGIALALFGTLALYLAAQPVFGPGEEAMRLSALTQHAARLNGPLLTLAFVLLLFGYGARAALVPLHGWLADAFAEGPAPFSTALGVLTLNVPLLAILRFQHLLQANAAAGGGAMRPGPFLLAVGIASLLAAAFSLWRRRDARRFFGFSAAGHGGIAVFAFGVGGPAAIFAGLLHMLLHTLLKSALFQALPCGGGGDAQPARRLSGAAILALTGLPPSPLFVSEFLIVSQTVQRLPLLSLPLGLGLTVYAVALLRMLGPMLRNPVPEAPRRRPAGAQPRLARASRALASLPAAAPMLAAVLLLALALLLAFAMPWPLVRALSGIAESLQ